MKLYFAVALLVCTMSPGSAQNVAPVPVAPLVIGETLEIVSQAVGETRRINVYTPPVYTDSPNVRLPILYMPDGGIAEDFLHIAGLVQVSVGNGTMRPFILVGIENTQRRRDMTGPTTDPEDRKIAPQVGGSAAFRQFIKSELMPFINSRYRTTGETAIIGESLAGLFIAETFVLEPELFNTYIAIDPSLWWNKEALITRAENLKAPTRLTTLFVASSGHQEVSELSDRFVAAIRSQNPANLLTLSHTMSGTTHATIYHPAAMLAFHQVFKP